MRIVSEAVIEYSISEEKAEYSAVCEHNGANIRKSDGMRILLHDAVNGKLRVLHLLTDRT